jgi:hypothetical protein
MTSGGVLRTGPYCNEIQDHVCVFLESNTPMILRPSWNWLEYHRAVVQCFIVEFMDKEASLGPLQSQLSSLGPALVQWISIRNERWEMMYFGVSVAIGEDPRLGEYQSGTDL